jgi:hypothetical protein
MTAIAAQMEQINDETSYEISIIFSIDWNHRQEDIPDQKLAAARLR